MMKNDSSQRAQSLRHVPVVVRCSNHAPQPKSVTIWVEAVFLPFRGVRGLCRQSRHRDGVATDRGFQAFLQGCSSSGCGSGGPENVHHARCLSTAGMEHYPTTGGPFCRLLEHCLFESRSASISRRADIFNCRMPREVC